MKSTLTAISSAIFSSICCIVPLALSVFGLGSLGLGAVIGKYHRVFLIVGFFMILFSWRKYLRERRRCIEKECQMKNKKITLAILIIATITVTFFIGLNFYPYVGGSIDTSPTVLVAGLETVKISVEGMTCFTCEIAVSSALKKVDGVTDVKVSAKEGLTRTNYDPLKTNIGQLVEIINNAGFKARFPE